MGMFAKRPPAGNPQPAAVRDPNSPDGSYFGKTIAITGTVSGEDPVTLLGRLNGEIRLQGRLTIGPQANIEGVISAETVTAGGKISGEMTVGNTLHLEQSATVSGRVATAKLSVREGAVFNGELKMGTQPRGRSVP